MSTSFLNGRVTLWAGDCLDVLQGFETDSFDSCVTDPPYHLASIVKRFGKLDAAEAQFGTDGAYRRASTGFMGRTWDGGDVAFRPETWAAVLRILKPGAHLIAFGGTRTYHRLACAIEDAGFEIRDAIMWHYGSGFPKSHDVSKGIDRAAGAERTEIVGVKPGHETFANRGNMSSVQSFKGTMGGDGGFSRPWMDDPEQVERYHSKLAPATDSARQWEGWGTALKPATEILVLARKPLSEPTIVANVLRWGTGAINIDKCRIAGEVNPADAYFYQGDNGPCMGSDQGRMRKSGPGASSMLGRWPANVIHDGSDEVVEEFPETDSGAFKRGETARAEVGHNGIYGRFNGAPDGKDFGSANSGSAARFFYTAKADSDDRLGSKHPTVKPLDLMQYLCRLVCPPKGTILDPFAGTGTTGEAAWREGFNAVLIEREPEYLADIERRMALCLAGPDERARESIKARQVGKPQDHGPLFAEVGKFNAEAV